MPTIEPHEDWEWRLEGEPWLATGQTRYAWLAERPELYCQDLWNPKVAEYRFVGMAVDPPDCGVYFLLQADRQILYIGKSNCIFRRLQAHWRDGRIPFTHVWWVEAPEGCIDVLESYLIGIGIPPFNRKYDPAMQRLTDKLEKEIKARRPASAPSPA